MIPCPKKLLIDDVTISYDRKMKQRIEHVSKSHSYTKE